LARGSAKGLVSEPHLEFGYRFLADEVRQAGHEVCDRTVLRICRDHGWWSVFGKPRS
jgi:putative transposase